MLDRKKNDYYFNLFLNLARATYMNLEKNWDMEAKICGISYAQQHCMWILHIQDGLTLQEIGNIALWNKSTTSALVTRLEAKGLVEKRREPHSNEIHIFLTELGYETINKSVNTEECIDYMGLFKNYEEEEIQKIIDVFRSMSEQVSKGKNEDFYRFIDEYSKNLL